jgi:hypothetical protein
LHSKFNRDTSLTIAVGCDEGLLLCVSSGLADGKTLGSEEEIVLGRDDGKSLGDFEVPFDGCALGILLKEGTVEGGKVLVVVVVDVVVVVVVSNV